MRGLATVTVVVADYDAAIEHYCGDLGFELVADEPLGDGRRWVVVRPGPSGAALLLARAASDAQRARIGDQTGGRVFLFLETDSFEADFARLARAGVRFVGEPRSEPYGTVVVFEDAFGNRWDLIQPA